MRFSNASILGLFLVGIAGSAMCGLGFYNAGALRPTFWLEVAKTGLSVVTVAVLGGGASWAYKLLEAQRDEARRLVEYKKELVSSLRVAFLGIKKLRRQLRAGGLSDMHGDFPKTLSATQRIAYHDGMASLNELELEIERVRTEVTALLPLFSDGAAAISAMERVEIFLHRVIAEWEACEASGVELPEATKLSCLREFTDSSKRTFFKNEVSEQLACAMGCIHGDVLPGFQGHYVNPDRGLRLSAPPESPVSRLTV